MGLRLYNTLTRTKEDFVPIDPANIRMYVCGPTVYDFAHIGNARPIIVFDVLFRLLRHLYRPEHVTYVRNITDVDDKINARAAEEGIPIRELTERTTQAFHEDIRALGVLTPEDVNTPGANAPRFIEPRATDHIAPMIAMIERLIESGNAYVAEGHVLFDVSSKPDYGKLSNRSLDEMIAGARVDVAPYKRGPMDFVLWKPSPEEARSGDAATGSKMTLPGWDSPWGRGRPGWHIECSAMSAAYLGEVFDIHGGGIDLVFPHHENEIAQSECAHHRSAMANYWMHNGFLQVEGEKMSKSLGNFVTIRELLSQGWDGRVWHGEEIRLAMLKTHYRQPIDWTVASLEESRRTLDHWYRAVDEIDGLGDEGRELDPEFLDALSDDLNTPRAIGRLHELYADTRGPASGLVQLQLKRKLRASARQLGLLSLSPTAFLTRKVRPGPIYERQVEDLIEVRAAARKAKNFPEADRIRAELDAMGIALKDAKDPKTGELVTTWEVKR